MDLLCGKGGRERRQDKEDDLSVSMCEGEGGREEKGGGRRERTGQRNK